MPTRLLPLIAVALAVVAAVPAGAHHMPPREFDTAQECMQSGGIGFDHMPTCTRSGGGPWVARYGHGGGGGGGAFAAFILFALLWSLAPAVISGIVASDRGQSVGLAVLIGLVLGWIGLLIVVFVLKEDVARAARNVVDSAARREPLMREPSRPANERLAELDRLRAEKLITDAEFDARRARILDEI